MTSKKKTKKKARGKRQQPELTMISAKVAGIDISAREHWVCAPSVDGEGQEVASFGATTPELHRLAKWLLQRGVESVAMESTYMYWVPLFEVLEEAGLEVVLTNAHALKGVPGRKSDLSDCQWLAVLHSHGLLSGSFRPEEAICRVRALNREKRIYIKERARCVMRMQKALDNMNVRVHRAVTDITGKTGMSIVRAIVAGERDPRRLAEFRDSRCKRPVEDMVEELTGNWRREHLCCLEAALHAYDLHHQCIETFESTIAHELAELRPPQRCQQACPDHPTRTKQREMKKKGELELRELLFQVSGVDLTTIDGVCPSTALAILTEIGFDVSMFPTEKHFVSHLRLCPRRGTSGGKPVKTRKGHRGSPPLTPILRIAAIATQRSSTAMGAEYRRVASRSSGKKASFVVARRIAVAAYRMLRYGTAYHDIGQMAYEARFQERRLRAMHRRAREMGFELSPAA